MDEPENDEPKNGWVAMWQALATIVFILCCFAYCTSEQWVEILK